MNIHEQRLFNKIISQGLVDTPIPIEENTYNQEIIGLIDEVEQEQVDKLLREIYEIINN